MEIPKSSVACIAMLIALPAQAQTFKSSAGDLKVETVVGGLANPWALAFLPDGRMLVTERPGRMRIATRDGKLSAPLANVPAVFARSQGGLHDVALDRGFAQNRTIYFCYAEPATAAPAPRWPAPFWSTSSAALDDVKVIFRQEGPLSTARHFGCRIVQTPDNNLFLTLGDHGSFPNEAQNLANHIGKIVRVAPDGAVPRDNRSSAAPTRSRKSGVTAP